MKDSDKRKPAAALPPVVAAQDDKPVVDGDWFRARTKELGLTQRQVADHLRRDYALLSRSYNGERAFDARDVAGLTQILKVSSDEILTRMGLLVDRPGVPVVGRVLPDGRVSQISSRKGQRLCDVYVPEGSEAVVCECDAGPLAPYNGAAFVYRPTDKVPPDAVGRLCVVSAEEEIVPVLGTLQKADARGRVKLVVFGSNEERLLAKVVSAAVVIKIVLA